MSALEQIMLVEKGGNHIELYMWNDMGTMCVPVALIYHTLSYCDNTYVLLKHYRDITVAGVTNIFRMNDVKDWGKGVVYSVKIGHLNSEIWNM